MAFEVPPLPYDYDALEPTSTSRRCALHHDKHHQAYVDNANKALEGTPLADKSGRARAHQPRRPSRRHADGRAQQRRRPREPLALLGDHGPGRRRRADRRARRGDRPTSSGQLRRAQEGGQRRTASSASAPAGPGWCTTAPGSRVYSTPNQDSPILTRRRADPRHRRLGARLLPQVPEPAARLPRAWWNVVNWDAVAERFDQAVAELGAARPTSRTQPLVTGGTRPGRLCDRARASRTRAGRVFAAGTRRGRRARDPAPGARARGAGGRGARRARPAGQRRRRGLRAARRSRK